MQRTAYWLCFFLVLFSAAIGWSSWLFYLAGKGPPYFLQAASVFSFGSLVPAMFSYAVPRFVHMVLGYVMLFLLGRRIWLLFSKKQRVPSSFQGFPKALGYIGAFSFAISAVGFAISIALQAGSGVPAALLMLPALICVPWSFFLTEVFSFRRSVQA